MMMSERREPMRRDGSGFSWRLSFTPDSQLPPCRHVRRPAPRAAGLSCGPNASLVRPTLHCTGLQHCTRPYAAASLLVL